MYMTNEVHIKKVGDGRKTRSVEDRNRVKWGEKKEKVRTIEPEGVLRQNVASHNVYVT